ncbi:MAG: CdvA-like protein [Thermoproteota archaeon]|nr:CdvA-like protein [Thermoproteota archaeon]
MEPASNLFTSLGKQVEDEYGRSVGKVASFDVNPNGFLSGVFIQHGDGEFMRYPVGQLKIDDTGVILLSPIKTIVTNLSNRIPLIWRKDEALNDLQTNKKIPPDMYEDLHRNFEGALNQLKEKAKALLNKIAEQIGRCTHQVQQLNSALINLEIEREIGKIDEEMYQTAMGIVQEELKRSKTEKNDLEEMRKKLSNLTLGERLATTPEEKTQPPEETHEEEGKEELPSTSSPPNLPKPPVVVYVNTSKNKKMNKETVPTQ